MTKLDLYDVVEQGDILIDENGDAWVCIQRGRVELGQPIQMSPLMMRLTSIDYIDSWKWKNDERIKKQRKRDRKIPPVKPNKLRNAKGGTKTSEKRVCDKKD